MNDQELEYVGFWPRVGAALIDTVLLMIVCWPHRQATPGKMAIGARILDARTGGKPATSQLVIHYFGYCVSTIPFVLGLIWVGFDPRKQGWHDKLAGIVVVRSKLRGTHPVKF